MNGWAGTPSYFMMQTTSFAHLEAPPAYNNNFFVKVHGAQVVEAVGPRGRIRGGMGKSEEHEKRQMLRVLMFQEIQNKDLMYLHDFEKKTHFENNFNQTFFWFLTSTFFFVCQCVDPMIFLQRARAWALLVFVIILLLRVWLRFFFQKEP